MNDLSQFSTLAALIIGGFGLVAFMYTRLEKRVDQLHERMREMERSIPKEFATLRRDLADEFRAQRAEVAAQVAAIASAITAARGG